MARDTIVAVTETEAIAIKPGRITMKGKSILGTAAISGVRRAEFMESAAMARCTTRKSVHQYPNESTKPSPITSPNHSMPKPLLWAFPIPFHECVRLGDSFWVRPCQPPTFLSPSSTRGRSPAMIRKNCNTSL